MTVRRPPVLEEGEDYRQIKYGLLHGLLTKDRFRLLQTVTFQTGIYGYSIDTTYIRLDIEGRLTIRKNWEWDGASGPTLDSARTMAASLVHDALYELIRKGFLPRKTKWKADLELYRILRANQVNHLRAISWLLAVDLFAGWWTGMDKTNKNKENTS